MINLSDYSFTVDSNGRGNLTLLRDAYNNTVLYANYQYQKDSASKDVVDNVNTTVLDSFELGVIALIVLAAVVILGVLFMMSNR